MGDTVLSIVSKTRVRPTYYKCIVRRIETVSYCSADYIILERD